MTDLENGHCHITHFLFPSEQKDIRRFPLSVPAGTGRILQSTDLQHINPHVFMGCAQTEKERFWSELAIKGMWAGLCRERWPKERALGPGRGHDEAMTALCSTNVPGLSGPDKEEFAVKLPMPLPFSPLSGTNRSFSDGASPSDRPIASGRTPSRPSASV
jgi:hypothetical protein